MNNTGDSVSGESLELMCTVPLISSFQDGVAEDKGVDLYVLERAFIRET